MRTLLNLFIGVLFATSAWAHCDGVDGPVARAAVAALEKNDVRPALVWTQPAEEKEVRAAFAKAVAVRALGADAKALGETYFMETVVRLHRAGEGAPYTGLKPAGRDLGPAIPAADAALAGGSPDALAKLLAEAVEHGVRERFAAAARSAKYDASNVEAGRAHVKAYVEFLHYVEAVHGAAGGHHE